MEGHKTTSIEQQVIKKSKIQDNEYLIIRSLSWDHFKLDEQNEQYAICQICLNVSKISAKASRDKDPNSFNTTNIRSYLKAHHICQYDQMVELENQQFLQTETLKQQKIDEQFKAVHHFPDDYKQQNQITDLIGYRITEGNLAFRIVENRSLQSLLKILEPKFKLKTRQYYSKIWLNQQYEKQIKLIQKELQKQNYVRLTTDLWKSNSLELFTFYDSLYQQTFQKKRYLIRYY